ncbi:MAG: AAA family ATPase [bacterium]|nr:AAA family ATPase [bacterium]
MIKISFSGISGSGKTSLLNEVKKILALKYKVGSIDEINGKNPFDNDKRSSFVSQFFYVSTQINEENIHSTPPADYLLCDRSVLDQWIYWKNYIAEKEMTTGLESKNKVLEELYRFWIKTYDLIFLIRMDLKELENREYNSEFRHADPEYIKRTEEIFLETIAADGLKVIEIWNNNSVDESAHQIIKTISEFKESLAPPTKPAEPANTEKVEH